MPGLYLHIPFCKQACHYCDFHFSTVLKNKEAMVEALVRELEMQKDYLDGAQLTSLYFGGGTPSLLDTHEMVLLFETIQRLHNVAPDAEITLEANPDDLSEAKLADLRNYTPVNRLSIGIQSFADEDLRWMNRAHHANDAHACLRRSLAAGFNDLSIDLIYGAPTTSHEQWQENLRLAFNYGVPHLSCYSLTVEKGTALHHFVKTGKSAPVEEEKAARQFEYLIEKSAAAGYEHYEISNFALPGRYAKHNSSYWFGDAYLGIGPSAHAFNGAVRQWNVANNAMYISSLQDGKIPFESEVLTPEQRYNEYVMTALRTQWGIDRGRVGAFGAAFVDHLDMEAQEFLDVGALVLENGFYKLSKAGKLLADHVASSLFLV